MQGQACELIIFKGSISDLRDLLWNRELSKLISRKNLISQACKTLRKLDTCQLIFFEGCFSDFLKSFWQEEFREFVSQKSFLFNFTA